MIETIFNIYAKFFAKKIFLNLNYLLFHLGLRGLGILNYKGLYISGEKSFIEFLKKNYSLKVVFDVGAHNGEYAGMLKNHAQVFSFEPNPRSFKILMQKFENDQSVKTFDFGFSNSEGKFKIYDRLDGEGSQHASIFEGVISEIHKSEAVGIDINLTTIDKFVKNNNISNISLLKIDTEGNELAVLQGAIKTIRKSQVDVIHIEFNEMNVISKVFLKDIVDLLPDYNFYRLLPKEFLPIDYKLNRPLRYEIFAFQNIVAFRKEIDKVK